MQVHGTLRNTRLTAMQASEYQILERRKRGLLPGDYTGGKSSLF